MNENNIKIILKCKSNNVEAFCLFYWAFALFEITFWYFKSRKWGVYRKIEVNLNRATDSHFFPCILRHNLICLIW